MRAQPQTEAQTPPSQETIQTLFDEGRAAHRAKEFERSAALLFRALEALRRQGRAETVDDGLISAYLASTLDQTNHPQADNAFQRAFTLLSRAADLEPFLNTASAWLTRLHRLERADDGSAIAEQLVQRLERAGIPDEPRIRGLNIASDYLATIGRKEDADKVLERLGPLLEATTARAARVRGIVRVGLARASQRDGRLIDFTTHIEGAISDLRRAQPESSNLLAAALNAQGKMLFEEGLYNDALPLFTESTRIAPEDMDIYIEAASLQARVLNRIEQNEEALAVVERLIADVELKAGADSRLAFAARLDRVEMLMYAGRLTQGRQALEAEGERLGGTADAMLAAQYFDRLAAIELAEEDYASAAKSAEQSIEAYRTALPHVPVLQIEPMRKRALASEGMVNAAYTDRVFRELIDLSVRVYKPEHPEVARDLNAYAMFLQVEGRWDEAEALLRRAAKGLERAYGATGLKYAYGLNNLANVLTRSANRSEAAQLLEHALTIVGDAPDRVAMRALLRLNYANALNVLNRPEEALAVLQKIRDELPLIRDKPERHALHADMMSVMSLARLGRLGDAWRAGAKALDQMRIRTKEDAQNVVNLLLQMGDVARRADDPPSAMAAMKKAAEVMAVHGVETNQLWREWAQVSLPSLWRLGNP